MRVGSLFSGAGLGDLGLSWAGFEHSWFCEVDEYARKVLSLRWPGIPIYGDIQELDFSKIEKVDLLAGGFPCQDISEAGTGEGLNGKRSGLWFEFKRAISVLRPKFILIENSARLTDRGLDTILCNLAALRYDAEWQCIPASAFGLPHKRDRIWIIAYPMRYGMEGLRKAVDPFKVRQRRESCAKDLPEVFANPLTSGKRFPQPLVRRMDDGNNARVDRLRCIGNGQIPYCTYALGQRIIQLYN